MTPEQPQLVVVQGTSARKTPLVVVAVLIAIPFLSCVVYVGQVAVRSLLTP